MFGGGRSKEFDDGRSLNNRCRRNVLPMVIELEHVSTRYGVCHEVLMEVCLDVETWRDCSFWNGMPRTLGLVGLWYVFRSVSTLHVHNYTSLSMHTIWKSL